MSALELLLSSGLPGIWLFWQMTSSLELMVVIECSHLSELFCWDDCGEQLIKLY